MRLVLYVWMITLKARSYVYCRVLMVSVVRHYSVLSITTSLYLLYIVISSSAAYHSKCIDPWLTNNRRVCPVCKRKVFAHDEQPPPDTDSDSDADDTTPLINPVDRNNHGTFVHQAVNPFERAARSVSQITESNAAAGDGEQTCPTEGMFVTASGDHSINAETLDNDIHSGSSYDSASEFAVLPSTSVEITRDRDLVI